MTTSAQRTVLHLDLSMPRPITPTFPTQTPPSLQTSLTCLDDSSSILQPSLEPNLPKPYLRFLSPIPELLGMRTACEWHHEQLLRAHLRMEQHNALCLKRGQILTTLTTSQICDHAQEDVVQGITAMDIPCHHNPDNPWHLYPFHPGHYPHSKPRELQSDRLEELPKALPTWRLFASRVKMLSCWSISCPAPSKRTTKIPMQYCPPTLPKGWVYEDIEGEAKQEVLSNLMLLSLIHPATTPLCPTSGTEQEHQSRRQSTSRSMRATGPYPLPSMTSSDGQRLRATSRST